MSKQVKFDPSSIYRVKIIIMQNGKTGKFVLKN